MSENLPITADDSDNDWRYADQSATAHELEDVPSPMECYRCADFPNFVLREVTKLGPVVNPADPTQTYVLSCGHTV